MICTSIQNKTYDEILALLDDPWIEMAEIRLDDLWREMTPYSRKSHDATITLTDMWNGYYRQP